MDPISSNSNGNGSSDEDLRPGSITRTRTQPALPGSDVARMTSNASSSSVVSSPSSWSFAGLHVHSPDHARPSATDRPRSSRQSSLPHALLASNTPSSVFGAAAPPSDAWSSHDRLITSSDRRPLAALQSPTMKEQQCGDRERTRPTLIPRVEKDVDDITAPPASSRHGQQESTTLSTLSRLFAVQAGSSPEHSRHSSYIMRPRNSSPYSRWIYSPETAALPDHLYSRGLLSGKHSDITIHAFGHPYRLHRIILDRAPFFASALSEPWLEASAKEMSVHPEDIDTSITQTAFELALKRLYGCGDSAEEDRNTIGLFATGCWLEMQDLIDTSIESMLRQMTPDTLSPLIKLVTNNYYGRAGDKVLASAKSMLCRDGWRMSLKLWDDIPGDVIREIVGGDGFFINSEFDRWILAKRILDRRLRQHAIEVGLVEPGSKRKALKVPESARLTAIRFDSVYRKSDASASRGVPEHLQAWVTVYTHPDIEPVLVLLDEGIHYLHLDFEQLQFIRNAKDRLGVPAVSEKVISDALWQQMELRQKVTNTRDEELELYLSMQCSEDTAINQSRDATMSVHEASRAKGKRKVDGLNESEEIESGSWDGNGKPRKFWIPTSDANIVMGGFSEPFVTSSNNSTLQRHASRLSATIQPEDVQWAADFTAATSQPRVPLSLSSGDITQMSSEPLTVSYTHFPPFRFSAEFPNPRHLKEKKRVYSRTVFYAGSLWNIYIQKVASSRSKQLGVYLHRAKERETEEVIAGTAGLAQGSVDERIGQLEREMIMRSERRERRQRRRTTMGSDGMDGEEGESSGSTGVDEGALPSASGATNRGRSSAMRALLQRRHRKDGQTDILSSSPSNVVRPTLESDQADECGAESDSEDEDDGLDAASNRFHVPTLPPYVDARPTIKTYFKIYSPSRGGRMLSVYESAPDKFNFSQSWGWKSSTLMLDEGLGDDDDGKDDGKDEGGESMDKEGGRRTMKGRGDGKLRFMVVIGNI